MTWLNTGPARAPPNMPALGFWMKTATTYFGASAGANPMNEAVKPL